MTSSENSISEAVARLYLDKFGKGPLHADTHCHGDMAVTVLRDILTPAEKAMIGEGRSDSVLVTRMAWQNATDHMFRATVEEATGRFVMSAISGFQVQQEIATEVFLFAPESP